MKKLSTWLDGIVKRSTETAQNTVKKSVGDKVKTILPLGLGAGIAVWGLASFFGGSGPEKMPDGMLYSTSSHVTNNFYINTSNPEDILRIIKEVR